MTFLNYFEAVLSSPVLFKLIDKIVSLVYKAEHKFFMPL